MYQTNEATTVGQKKKDKLKGATKETRLRKQNNPETAKGGKRTSKEQNKITNKKRGEGPSMKKKAETPRANALGERIGKARVGKRAGEGARPTKRQTGDGG